MLARSSCFLLLRTRHGLAKHLDLRHIDPAARPVTAPGHEVGEADLVDFREIDFIQKGSDRHHTRDVELHPAEIGVGDLTDQPVPWPAFGAISHQPGAIGELHDGTYLMEARGLDSPANA